MSDSGSIVLGWLVKLAITLAILGLIIFDVLALVTTSFTVSDHANTDASLAADVYRQTHDVQQAFNAADSAALKDAETIDPKSFLVNTDTGHVTLTVHKTAVTLWMQHVGPLVRFTKITGVGEGNPPQ